MFRSKLSISLLLAIQLAVLFAPEIMALAPPTTGKDPHHNASHEKAAKHLSSQLAATNKVRPVIGLAVDTAAAQLSEGYIVILNEPVEVGPFVSALKRSFESEDPDPTQKNRIGYVYEDFVLHGFSARLSKKTFEKLTRSDDVLEIIPDTMLSIQPIEQLISDEFATADIGVQSPNNTVQSDGASDCNLQKGTAPWGLQRIDQRTPMNQAGSNPSLVSFNYAYAQPAGEGVTVYILDTGARASHMDFGGRVEMAAQFGGYKLADGNGHGTHCAGTVAGSRWGVAKRARVRAVKVLADDGSGSTSDVIAGVQYAVQQHRARGYKPSVVSLSLGGDKNSALDRAVQAAISQGLHFSVAAGNSNADACLSSPASVPGANVVAASDFKDNRASYSNWGTCVDLIAPGSDVTSAWFTADDAIKRISGTSMATPHVAGLIALHLSVRNMTTQQMSDKLKKEATPNAVYLGPKGSDAANTPNLLLYNTLQ